MKIYDSIIVDDNKLPIVDLSDKLKDLPFIKVVAEAMTLNEAKEKILYYKPDIVFLDIRMKGENVFSLLEEFDKKEFKLNMGVVFVTGYYKEYIHVPLEKKVTIDYPTGYIGKPVNINDLVEVLNKIREKLNHPELDKEYFTLPFQTGTLKLFHSDLLYITTMNVSRDHCKIITIDDANEFSEKIEDDDEGYTVRKSLSGMIKLLPKKSFYRLSGSFIVNMDYVRVNTTPTVEKYRCILKVGSIKKFIEIPPRRWAAFNKRLNQ